MSESESAMRLWFKDQLASRIDQVMQEETCPRADLTPEGWALLFVVAEGGLVRANPTEVHYADRGQGDGKIDIFYQTEDPDSGSVHFHIFQVHAPDPQKIRAGASRGEMTPGKLEEDVLGLHRRLTGTQRKLSGLNASAAAIYDKLTQELDIAKSHPTGPHRVFHIYPVCLKRVGQALHEKTSELSAKTEEWSQEVRGVKWKLHEVYTAEALRESITRNQSSAQPPRLLIRIEHGFAGEAEKPGRPFLCFGHVKELLDCYKQFGAGMFDGNLRYYLGRRTAVNSGIYQELQSETGISRFHRKNNGLTIACDLAKPVRNDGKGKSVSSFDLSRPQIINGGQTLVTIYDSYQQLATKRTSLSPEDKRRLAAIENMILPIKVIPERDPKIVDDIAVASNTQNQVSQRTLRSSTQIMRETRIGFAHGEPPWYVETKDGEWPAVKDKGDVFKSLTNGKRFQDFHIEDTKRYRRIDNTELGVALLAFYGHVQLAKKSRVFETGYFDYVFEKHIDDDSWDTLSAKPPSWGDQEARDRTFSVGRPSTAVALLAYQVYRFWSDLTYSEARQRELAWESQGDAFKSKYFLSAEGEWNVPSEVHSSLLADITCLYHREHYARAGYLVLMHQTMRILVRAYGRLTEPRCQQILRLPQFSDLLQGKDPTEFRSGNLHKSKTPLWTIARILLWSIEKLWLSRRSDLESLGSPQQALLNPEWVSAISKSTDEAVREMRSARYRLAANLMVEQVNGEANLADLLPDLPTV